jgi:hypothetical protein
MHFLSNFPTKNSYMTQDQENEEATRDSNYLAPKVFHKAAFELFTILMVELPCWKKIIPSPLS